MTPSRSSDVKSAARGSWRAIVNRGMKDDEKRGYIVKCVGKYLKYEVGQFCKKSRSVLLGTEAEKIKSFNWNMVKTHAKAHMPSVYSVLQELIHTRRERGNEESVMGTIICMLAKQKVPQMCLLQKVLSVLLYSGHCSKKVHIELFIRPIVI